MHEYPITEGIVKTASEHCLESGASRVSAVNLVCGEYSGFVPESIQLYFDIIAEGSPCEGARLNIERVRAKLRCPACGELFERKPLSFACPRCGEDGEPTETGKEFYIDSIEVED